MRSQSQSCCWLLLLLLLGVSAALSSSSSSSSSPSSFSGVGVDLSVLVDEEGWSCVQRNLSASSPSEPFAVVRVYRNIGEVDANAASSIHSAYSAGFRLFSGYIFPCVASSPFAVSRDDVECVSAEKQLADTLASLQEQGIRVKRSGDEGSTYGSEPIIQRLYLDIEDESPSLYFDPKAEVNQQLVADFVTAAREQQVSLGFYTTATYWNNIMDNIALYSEPDYPLWYPRWDNTNSMEFFEPFAGWGDVLIKQTGGDVAMCGISQVDTDFMERD